MEFFYELNENDFLKLQLFWTSKNKTIMHERRLRSIKIFFLFFIVFLLSLYFKSYLIYFPDFHYIFPIVAIVVLLYDFFYLDKKRYEKLNRKMIQNEYKHLIGKTNVLHFKETYLTKNDTLSELEVAYNNLELIEELKEDYYFKLKSGSRIVLPKSAITKEEDFTNFLNEIITKNSIMLLDEKKWKWE